MLVSLWLSPAQDPGAVPQCGVPPVGELQPPRALWSCHGPRHLLCWYWQQGEIIPFYLAIVNSPVTRLCLYKLLTVLQGSSCHSRHLRVLTLGGYIMLFLTCSWLINLTTMLTWQPLASNCTFLLFCKTWTLVGTPWYCPLECMQLWSCSLCTSKGTCHERATASAQKEGPARLGPGGALNTPSWLQKDLTWAGGYSTTVYSGALKPAWPTVLYFSLLNSQVPWSCIFFNDKGPIIH